MGNQTQTHKLNQLKSNNYYLFVCLLNNQTKPNQTKFNQTNQTTTLNQSKERLVQTNTKLTKPNLLNNKLLELRNSCTDLYFFLTNQTTLEEPNRTKSNNCNKRQKNKIVFHHFNILLSVKNLFSFHSLKIFSRPKKKI